MRIKEVIKAVFIAVLVIIGIGLLKLAIPYILVFFHYVLPEPQNNVLDEVEKLLNDNNIISKVKIMQAYPVNDNFYIGVKENSNTTDAEAVQAIIDIAEFAINEKEDYFSNPNNIRIGWCSHYSIKNKRPNFPDNASVYIEFNDSLNTVKFYTLEAFGDINLDELDLSDFDEVVINNEKIK